MVWKGVEGVSHSPGRLHGFQSTVREFVNQFDLQGSWDDGWLILEAVAGSYLNDPDEVRLMLERGGIQKLCNSCRNH